jgi:hypothetical protein
MVFNQTNKFWLFYIQNMLLKCMGEEGGLGF